MSCTSLGPLTIPTDRFNYNEAVARSSKEQLLRNVIRLRYGDTPHFLEVASVLGQYTVEAGASLQRSRNDLDVFSSPALRAAFGVDGDPGGNRSYGGSLSYVDRPTITYHPLQGGEYARRILAPISPAALILLSQAGWGIDHVLRCCVQQINGIGNSPLRQVTVSSDSAPDNFYRLVVLMRKLQDAGVLEARVERAADEQTIFLRIPSEADGPFQDDRRQLMEMLRLDPQQKRFRLVASPVQLERDEIAMQTRSLHATMVALSQEFTPPADHVNEGRTLPRFTGTDLPDHIPALLTIKHGPLPTTDSFVGVSYRGRWFYIPDGDLVSKKTFALLTSLYSLQSGDSEAVLPLITVPVGS